MAKPEMKQNKKRNKKSSNKGRFAGIWRILLFIAMAVVTWAILSINFQQDEVFLTEGEIATDDYFYEGRTTTYTSHIKTEAAREAAAAEVDDQYIIDDAVAANLETVVRNYFDMIWSAASGNISVRELQHTLPGNCSLDLLRSITDLREDDILDLRDTFIAMIKEVYAVGIQEDEVEQARQQIAMSISASSVTGDKELFLKTLNNSIVYSYNKVFDSVATENKISSVKNNVPPVQVTVMEGEKLVSRGQMITAEQVEALQELGLQGESKVLTPTIGLLIFILVLYLVLYFYIRSSHKQTYDRQSAIMLIGVVMVVILFVCKLVSLVGLSMNGGVGEQLGYLMPVAAASMVLAVLLDREIAILCTVILSVFVGVAMGGNMMFGTVALVGGVTGVITATRLDQRSQFVGASMYVILANILVIAAWGLIFHHSYSAIGIGMAIGLVNGLLSSILAMGILPYLENVFGITTVIKLLELSNSNHPLLKRLMMEAPGTYNHSILVGNLAEAAADAIGADPLLVRVSSYYHDIGKLKRPHFYIENQRPGDNPHDRLQPGLSAMIITSHTTDGAKMLRAEHFPEEIIDVVEQHHGSGLLTFFYQKAKKQALDPEEIKRGDYCYKGRKPQTKEAALVMLADSVQAAVQSLAGNDKDAVEEKVRSVIDSKLQDGQLSECPLTFRDLGIISESFLMVLSGMNHQRIAYPDTNKMTIPEGMVTKSIMQEIKEGASNDDR